MTNRLPTPGSDNGTWGDILNAYLEVSLASDGTLNSNVVGTAQLQNNCVTNAQLDTPTQTAIASVASKYTKPAGGIPSSDLSSAVQTSLSSANSSVQLGGDLGGTNSSPTVSKLQGTTVAAPSGGTSAFLNASGTWTTPAAGVTLDGTVGDIQPDTVSGTAVVGSTGKAADAGHQHTLVTHDHSTTNKGGQITPTTGLSATGAASSSTYLRGDNTWTAPPTASNATNSTPGLVQLSGSLGGSATSPTVVTNANLTGDVTSSGNATTLTNSSNVESIITANTTVAGALQKTNNLSDVSDAGTSRANIHVPALTPAACVVTTNVSTMSGLNTYDGYTTVAGDLILLTGQTTTSQNGLWTAASGSWTRPTEMGTGVSLKARTVPIIQGTTYGGSTWLLKANSSITVDTTSQTWVSQLPSSVVSVSSVNGMPWVTGTVYGLNEIVTNGGSAYICNTPNTAGATFAGDAAKWTILGAALPASVNQTVSALGNCTGTVNLDASVASIWTAALTGNTTFNFINVPSSRLFAPQLFVVQNGSTAYTVSFTVNSSVITPQWDTGVAMVQSATLSSTTIWNLETPDAGTTWYGQGQT